MRQNLTRLAPVAIVLSLMATACTGGSSPDDQQSAQGDFSNVGDCTPVVAAVSSEKVNLFAKLSDMFRESPQGKALDTCAAVVPVDVASGEAARLLKLGWPEAETDKPRPVIWSPASTNWVDQVADAKSPALVPDPVSFARTPVVIAMPEVMAKALGWPQKQLGLKDLQKLCVNPQGWASVPDASPVWGSFKLAKTNPNTSTTGQNVLLMQNYASAGKQADLTEADITAGTDFSKSFESCVIHYGDTTGKVLDRVYKRDADGQPLNYLSAVAVEETSVINYNLGNPTSSVVQPGTQLTPPKSRLVAVYPQEGSLESNNPIVVLGQTSEVTWVTPEQRTAAKAFAQFVLTPEAQAVLGDFGFRPHDPKVAPSGQVNTQNGVDPAQPTLVLPNPAVPTVAAALRQWQQVRKPSSVLELVDISGSMVENNIDDKRTRLDGAKQSAVSTLGHFRPTDELGVWVFSTDINSSVGKNIIEIKPVSPMAGARENLANQINKLDGVAGTPLYDALSVAYSHMQKRAEPGRINAIILLSDGEDTDSELSFDDLMRQLRASSKEGNNDLAPVRVFPIVYGENAPTGALDEIAEATGGQVFNASDPRRINLVFQQVVNNF